MVVCVCVCVRVHGTIMTRSSHAEAACKRAITLTVRYACIVHVAPDYTHVNIAVTLP